MRVVYLGFAISDEMFADLLARDQGMPTPSQRFGWALVGSFAAGGANVDVVSAEPAASYPHNSSLLIQGRTFSRGRFRGESMSFINFPGLKHLTRYFAAYRLLAARSRRETLDVIVVHGVHSPFLWAALRAGRQWGARVVVVLTDAPSLRTPFDSRLTMLMKRVDRRIITRAVERSDGVVALSAELAATLAPSRPAMLMEGIATDLGVVEAPGSSPLVVTYAGRVDRRYGVLDLVQCRALATGDWLLKIVGTGPDVREVEEAASRDDRIEYLGAVAPERIGEVYSATDVLVNPRPPDTELARQSFPSKLLEYMATGLPVITTALPTIPPDYVPHLFISDSGAEGLAAAIDAVVFDHDEAVERGAAARKFILSTRGFEARGRRLFAFVEGLA